MEYTNILNVKTRIMCVYRVYQTKDNTELYRVKENRCNLMVKSVNIVKNRPISKNKR